MNFEKASRLKLRFTTGKGTLSVEDLWDLPLTSKSGVSLESLALDLYGKLESAPKVSFVTKAAPKDSDLQLRFDIVKRVIDTRLEESEAKTNEAATKQHNQNILRMIEQKKNAEMESMSVEDLQKLLK